MIPKIAHFHWDGKPMPWLRMVGLHTFIRLNPRWDVMLHRTPQHIRDRKLPGYHNEADWTWLEKVHEHGGFAMATDTVFVRPVPNHWCEADLCGCANGKNELFHCCFGAARGLPFVAECVEECSKTANPHVADQDLGILLLNRVIQSNGGLRAMVEAGLDFIDMPVDAMTPVMFTHPQLCWENESLPVTENTVGVTWFGGHFSSREKSWGATPESPYAIVKLANEVLGE